MANEFLSFAGTDIATNLLTNAEYLADTDRPIGNQPGIARSKLQNKASRQAAAIISQLADITADRLSASVLDDGDLATLKAQLALAFPGSPITATKTTTYAIAATDTFVPCDASGGSFTVTLPTAVGFAGKSFVIKRIDQTLANAVTIATTGAQTIDGITTRKLMTQWEAFKVTSNGANWYVADHEINGIWTTMTSVITGSVSNPTKGTTSIDNYRWRRSGNSFEAIFTYKQSGAGVVGSGKYLVGLPTGLTFDSSMAIGTDQFTGATIGNGVFGPNRSNYGAVNAYNTTNFMLSGFGEASSVTAVAWGSTEGSLANAATFANMTLRAPITNWEG